MANTDSADINEIQLGYFLSNNWKNFVGKVEAEIHLRIKKAKVGEIEYDTQTERAKVMSDEVLRWSKINGYDGPITKVWWTARPGVLSSAVGKEVDSRKNPTDVLLQFRDGNFLGLSAKSTKTKGDIGFKNPGLGTVEKALGSFKPYLQDAVNELIKEYGVSTSAATRRKEIRASKEISDLAETLGKKVLNQIRDELFSKISRMNQKTLLNYILNDWMDANEVYPRYVKVTGMRTGAKIEDPLSNNKITALSTKKISLSKIGNDSIGIMAGQKRIMKMRAKFEAKKLTSPIKFSGDPWV